MASTAVVVIAEEEFLLSMEGPFVFGRSDGEGVVGLDPNDMGISSQAGSVESERGFWWVVNRSRKRPLLLDIGGGGALQRLESGHRHAVNCPHLSVLVPGVIYTHRLEVIVPAEQLANFHHDRPPTGTITGEIHLTENERNAVVALLAGYLEDFPRRNPRPRSYQEAADALGPPWTKTTVRKQIERLKDRLAAHEHYFEGPQANYDLADHLVGQGVVTAADLSRLADRP